MKIASIFHGGMGDQLLCNRFTPAILEAFDIKKIDIIRPYINNEDEHKDRLVLDFVKNSFFHFYNEVKFCKIKEECAADQYLSKCSKADNNFFGYEVYDKVYNFVPDNLKFLQYNELQINKYYNFFSKPHIKIKELETKDYIFFFPAARENQHHLHKFPIDFSKSIVDTFASKYKLICPVSKTNYFLKDYCEKIGVETYECDLYEMWAFAKNCKMAICCDSGPKLFPMHFDKPVFTVTGFFDKAGPAYDFLVRWLLNKKYIFHFTVDPKTLLKAADIVNSGIEARLNIDYF
jgi:hypothetical protein